MELRRLPPGNLNVPGLPSANVTQPLPSRPSESSAGASLASRGPGQWRPLRPRALSHFPCTGPRCHAGVHPIGVSSDSRDEALPQSPTAAGGAQWDSQGCHARRDWPRGTAVLPSPHRRYTQTGKQLSGQPHGRAGRRSPCDTASKTPRFTRRDSQPGTGRPCQRQDTTRGAHSSDGRTLITTVACGSWSRATFLPTNTCGDKNNIEPGATEK